MVNDSLKAIFFVVLSMSFGVACHGQTAMEVMERCNGVARLQGSHKLEFNGKFVDVFQKVLVSGELATKQMTTKNGDYSLTIGGERFEVFQFRRLIVDCSGLDAKNVETAKELFEGKANNLEFSPFVLAGEDTVFGIKCWKITRTFASNNAHSLLIAGGFEDMREIENYVAKDTFRIHARLVKDSEGKSLLTLWYTDYKDIAIDDDFFALPGGFEKVIPKSQEQYLAVLRYASIVKPITVGQYQHIGVSVKDMKRSEDRFPNLSWTFWVVGFMALAFFSWKMADIVLSTGSPKKKERIS